MIIGKQKHIKARVLNAVQHGERRVEIRKSRIFVLVGKRRFKIHDGIVRRRYHIFDILEILTEIIRSRIAVISGIELRHMVHDIACAQKGNIRIGKLLCLCIRRAGRGVLIV